MDDLSTKEFTTLSYNITVYIISSSASVQGLGTKKFTTLMESYQPENITDIELKTVREYYDEIEHDLFLDLTIGWSPGRDQTCKYDIIIYGNALELDTKPVPIEQFYEYTFTKLRSNEEYSIGIRGVNAHHPRIHSQEHWRVFSFLNELDASAKCQHISDNLFDVNVTWNEPHHRPLYYQIQIRDRYASQNLSTGIYEAEVDGVSLDMKKKTLFFPLC